MGKRKQGAPKKANETSRRDLTWNMLDRPEENIINLVSDHESDEEIENVVPSKSRRTLIEEKANNSHQTDLPSFSGICQGYRTDDLREIFSLYTNASDFHFRLSTNHDMGPHRTDIELGKFDLTLNLSPLFFHLPTICSFNGRCLYIFVNEDEGKHMLCYDCNDVEIQVQTKAEKKKYTQLKSKKPIKANNVKFWLFSTAVSTEVLQALKCKSFQTVLHDINENCVTVKIFASQEMIPSIQFPSEPVRVKMVNESMKILMSFFYNISEPCKYFTLFGIM